MDPLERMKLQTQIAKMQQKARKHDDVMALLNAAMDSIKRRDWGTAKKKFDEATKLYVPDVPVLDILVKSGKAISRAQARRLVAGGHVKVDGVRLRRDNAKVSPIQQVTLKGEVLQG